MVERRERPCSIQPEDGSFAECASGASCRKNFRLSPGSRRRWVVSVESGKVMQRRDRACCVAPKDGAEIEPASDIRVVYKFPSFPSIRVAAGESAFQEHAIKARHDLIRGLAGDARWCGQMRKRTATSAASPSARRLRIVWWEGATRVSVRARMHRKPPQRKRLAGLLMNVSGHSGGANLPPFSGPVARRIRPYLVYRGWLIRRMPPFVS